MKVCFFRHGPAVASGTPGVSEEDRPLTAEGRKKTQRAARGVRSLDLGIDAVYTSRLPRALETARILSRVLKLSEPRVAEELLPGGGPESVIRLLRSAKAECPILVGHEPDLTATLTHLAGGGAFVLKKAGLAVLEMKPNSPRPRGTMSLLLSPSTLRALAARSS